MKTVHMQWAAWVGQLVFLFCILVLNPAQGQGNVFTHLKAPYSSKMDILLSKQGLIN